MPCSIDDYGDFSDDMNTSGTRGDAPVEVLRMGWCWGAFTFTWVWAIGTRTYIAILISLLGVIGQFWLGASGHQLAWRHRRWTDMGQFQSSMRAWNRCGLWVFVATAILLFAALIVPEFLPGPSGR